MAAPNAKPTSTPEWASTASTVSPWAASTAYVAADLATNGGNVYEVVTGGTSAGSGGPTGTGTSITDGTVTWRYLGKAGTAGGITEPSPGRKQTGWLAGEKPPHGYFNWLSWLAWKWTAFLDTFNRYLQIWQNAAVFEGPPAWAPSTAYVVGEYVLNDGKVYVCTVAGTSAGSGGPTGTGTGIADNTVTWDFAQFPFDVEVPARTRKGLEATQSTTNAAAITATGNGTGAGVVATGGATGDGGTFSGGATSGRGVVATGTGNDAGGAFTGSGTGAGVTATGGTGASAAGVSGTAGAGSNGAGVKGQGEGIGAGVTGTGGGTAGPGVAGVGGATGGIGVTGVGGAGGGTGGRFTGSGATGNGVEGVGVGAGDGVRGEAPGSGVGGRFTGATGVTATGTASGSGVFATGGVAGPGATLASGTAATGATRQNALVVTNGDISMGAVNPDSNVGFTDTLTPTNIPKAWARIEVVSGVASVVAGFNIASATVGGGGNYVEVTFSQGFASANYATLVTFAHVYTGSCATQTATYARISGTDPSNAPINFTTDDEQFNVLFFGAQ